MNQSQPVFDAPETTLQPPCPTCGAAMWLVRRSTFDGDHDLRTFKCQVCEYTETVKTKFR